MSHRFASVSILSSENILHPPPNVTSSLAAEDTLGDTLVPENIVAQGLPHVPQHFATWPTKPTLPRPELVRSRSWPPTPTKTSDETLVGLQMDKTGLASPKWAKLWVEYEILPKNPVDQLLSITTGSERAKGKLLEWSARDGRWDIVANLFEIGVSLMEKQKAFRKVAGRRRGALEMPKLFDQSLANLQRGQKEAIGFAVGLAAMAAHFDEQACELLGEESVELPCWMLAECICLDGPGGKRLLEKCFLPREQRVIWKTPNGAEMIHDQMAFISSVPHTAVSASKERLTSSAETLLPSQPKLANALDHHHHRVQRTRAEIRVFAVKDVCHPDIIEALADSPGCECLSTEAARAIIEHVWKGAFVPYTVECALNFVFVCGLCHITATVRAGIDVRNTNGGIAWTVLLSLITFKDIVEELLQLCQTKTRSVEPTRCRAIRRCWRYACSLEQASDWFGIAIDIAGLCAAHLHSLNCLRRTILAVLVSVRWLRALYGLRGYESIGQKMLPILNALQDTVIFMLVVAFFLAAAVHAYYILGARSEPTPLYASILVMLRLGLLGDFDMFELEGVDPHYISNEGSWEPVDPSPTEMYGPVHVLFYIVGTCITLTLMNLLIGVLGSNYDRFEDQSIPIFLRSRALILVRHAARPWGELPWGRSCLHSNSIETEQDGVRKLSSEQLEKSAMNVHHPEVSRDGYLWVATQAEMKLEGVRSIRTVIREELRRASFKS